MGRARDLLRDFEALIDDIDDWTRAHPTLHFEALQFLVQQPPSRDVAILAYLLVLEKAALVTAFETHLRRLERRALEEAD